MSGMDETNSPFKPGQLAEARSFAKGYRGAWFRCKIKNVRRKDCSLLAETEYCDFPDQSVRWEKIYRQRSKHYEPKLMFRPQYPALYHKSEVLDTTSISEVAIIVNNAWQEGDLVDWFSDGCYWSGKVTKVLGNDKLKFELFPPPDGEGLSYEVSGEDLRPSLDWSLEHGWTLPKHVGRNSHSSCARLVNISSQGAKANFTSQFVEGTNNASASDEEPLKVEKDHKAAQTAIDKNYNPDNVSSLHVGNVSTEDTENRGGKYGYHDNPSKKMKANESVPRNTMSSGAIEAAVLDLEELRNRVKWIKDFLKFGMPLQNSMHPSWKFLEHQEPSLQK